MWPVTVLGAADWLLLAASAAYLLAALASVLAFRANRGLGRPTAAQVSVLRPLCGDEHGLEGALESLLAQDVDDARFSFVFGVASPHDPALDVARAVAARHPNRRVEFVVDPAVHGANPKVSNLINMSVHGLEEIVVVTDSDVFLPSSSLRRLVDATAPDDVGAVTALYRGRPWTPSSIVQRFGALYLDGWFLPTALLHARVAPAAVCYGQLTAIKRDVLPGGGFKALANALADDTELGHLARQAGRRVVFAPDVVEVCVNDASLRVLFAHELRWARTIRALQPIGYMASIVMHPGPLPLLLTVLQPGPWAWAGVLGLALLRWVLVATTHARLGRAAGLRAVDPVTLWVRDQLYFVVWITGFFGRRISWRGRALSVGPNATVEAVPLA